MRARMGIGEGKRQRDMDVRQARGPRPVAKLPEYMTEGFDKATRRNIVADIRLGHQMIRNEAGREASPSEILQLHQDVLYAHRYGASPLDLERGMIAFGPNRGKKIVDSKIALANKEGSLMGMEIRLASAAASTGVSTFQGGAAADKSLIYSFWDTGLHGSTAAVMPVTFVADMLRKRSRSSVFLPLCKQGIAPDLTWEYPIQTNTIYDELFEGTNLRDLKAAILPREEGESGTAHIRPKFDNANHSCRGYMLHSTETAEAVASRAYGLLGVRAKTEEFLATAPGALGDYDIVQAFWNGMELGYQRRFKATTNAWDVATHEVPFGKATFINGENRKHVVWWDYLNGKFYLPHNGVNYRKYAAGEAWPAGVFPAAANKLFEVLHMLRLMMAKKFRKLEAVWISTDFLTSLALDERSMNRLYETDNLVLSGEPGYKGTVRLPGTGDRVAIFEYQDGAVPGFSTADTDPLSIASLIIGCELGQAVTFAPFWPWTLMVDKEYEVETVDSQSVSRPTLRNVLTSYHMEAVEPDDLGAMVIAKCMNQAPPAA